MERLAGIFLHISSLPSPFPIGDLGPSAYRFVDFLSASGQKLWQVLPLNPTQLEHGNSPYFSTSLFAGNPVLISPELLYQDGLIERHVLESSMCEPSERVDYQQAYSQKENLLSLAFERFKVDEDFERFCQENSFWLEDYATFKVLRKKESKPWWKWSSGYKPSEKELLKEKFVQYVFFRQWQRLKEYANGKGIRLVGDLPIYPAHDSADVWSNKDIFKLRENGLPEVVAGVPPDYFSKTGQLWGNPVYRWESLQKQGFQWWLWRIRHALRLFDIVRFDHFRGFSAFYQVPYGEKTAEKGWWEEAPGYELFDKVKQEFPRMPFVAEDLGTIDEKVIKLKEHYGLPGMKVLVFAFFDKNSLHLPHNHTYNCVVYPSTHDTMPVKGWFYSEIDELTRSRVIEYLGYKPESISHAMVRLAYMSVAKYCIVPLQDILELGEESRMNTPGKAQNNWQWRLKALPESKVSEFLASLSQTYGRL